MKRDFLKELGLSDEQIDSIMQENGKDINNAKATNSSELENLRKENETLKADKLALETTNKENVDKYKDYEELKQFKANYELEQENGKRIDFLKSKGCKHPELISKEIKWDDAKYNEETKTFDGLDDTLKGLTEKYKDLFESKQIGHVDPEAQETATGDGDMLSRYKKEHPEYF